MIIYFCFVGWSYLFLKSFYPQNYLSSVVATSITSGLLVRTHGRVKFIWKRFPWANTENIYFVLKPESRWSFTSKAIIQCLMYVSLTSAILVFPSASHVVKFLFLPYLISAVVFLSFGFNGALPQCAWRHKYSHLGTCGATFFSVVFSVKIVSPDKH